MVTVTSGLNWKGEPCEFYMNTLLHPEMQKIKEVVTKKDFDYVAIVAGLPGMGKSNFAINQAKFCDENFTVDNICFTSEEFIEKTLTLPPRSAVILDESFSSMNSKIAMSKDFLRIINHLQLIRQRNLFIFLCLPNFFDLGKSVAIYRSMTLFVVYGAEFGQRGEFACYNRDKKRNLFVKGIKFMSYHAESPNFRGKFYPQKAIDENEYNKRKFAHLRENDNQLKEKNVVPRTRERLNKAIWLILKHKLMTMGKVADYFEVSSKTITRIKEKYGEFEEMRDLDNPTSTNLNPSMDDVDLDKLELVVMPKHKEEVVKYPEDEEEIPTSKLKSLDGF